MSAGIPPLLLEPRHVGKVWGGRALERYGRTLPEGPVGESFEASSLHDAPSRVASGPFAGRWLDDLGGELGKALLGRHGSLPFLVKVLDVRGPLSVQVHPGPERSKAMGLPCAKSEGWVVLEAGPGGRIGLGLLPSVSRAELVERCRRGMPQEAMSCHYPRKGEAYFIECGTVHYADGGLLLYEFQRPVDVTLRLHDWGRGRLDQVGTSEEALDAAFEERANGLPGRPPSVLYAPSRRDGTFEAGGFRVRYLAIDEGGMARQLTTAEHVMALTVIDGILEIESADHPPVALAAIQTAILPASLDRFQLAGSGAALLLEVRE